MNKRVAGKVLHVLGGLSSFITIARSKTGHSRVWDGTVGPSGVLRKDRPQQSIYCSIVGWLALCVNSHARRELSLRVFCVYNAAQLPNAARAASTA